MKSRMRPEFYVSPSVFLLEQQHIFRKLWLFGTFRQFLSDNNSFVTVKLAGLPIVFQNFNGTIRAFLNVCSHRHSPIQCEERGKRAFVCPYHGWRYGADGLPAKIPNEEAIYQYSDAERQGLKLTEYAVHIVGNFVFVCLDPNPQPIEHQLSEELRQSLESVSAAMDDEIYIEKITTKMNWKLAYENLRDANHVRYVHASTLFNYAEFEGLPDVHKIDDNLVWLSQLSYGGPDVEIPNLRKEEWHNHVERWDCENRYYNWILYPNIHFLSATCGYSFSLEHHNPISPTETEVSVYFLTAKKKAPYAESRAVLEGHMKDARIILDEDISVMEKIQSVVASAPSNAMPGSYEFLNRRAESWYLSRLNLISGARFRRKLAFFKWALKTYATLIVKWGPSEFFKKSIRSLKRRMGYGK